MMRTSRHKLRLLIPILCITSALSSHGLAQTTTPAPLPPDAQEAIKKGIIAAKQQDYLLALRFFQDARKSAPDAPEIFYNLGLAESKIPGRELRAICWLGAYLTANPNAQNATSVKDLIEALDVKSQSSNSRLIHLVQDAAGQIPIAENTIAYRPHHWDEALGRVASLWALSGDFETATKTIGQMQSTNDFFKVKEDAANDIIEKQTELLRDMAVDKAKGGDFVGAQKGAEHVQDNSKYKWKQWTEQRILEYQAEAQTKVGDFGSALKTADLMLDVSGKGTARGEIALAQAKAFDIAGAIKTAALIPNSAGPNDDTKDKAYDAIAYAQIKVGDFQGALNTASFIKNSYFKARQISSMSIAQAENGDIVGAQSTLELIQEDKDSHHLKCDVQIAIAKAQVATGELTRAQNTLVRAMATADQMPDDYNKSYEEIDIAEVQAEAGDIHGAFKTADLFQDGKYKSFVLVNIAVAQAKAGDITSALKTANLIQDVNSKSRALGNIAQAQAKKGDITSAIKTVDLIPDTVQRLRGPIYIAGGQAEAGDIAEALKTVALIQDVKSQNDALSSIAETQAKFMDIAGAQKTTALIHEADSKSWAQLQIVKAQVQAGTIQDAQVTANLIQVPFRKETAREEIAVAQAKAQIKAGGPVDSANAHNLDTQPFAISTSITIDPAVPVIEWTRRLDDIHNFSGDGELTDPVYLDFVNYLKSVPRDDPTKYFDALDGAVYEIIKRQNDIDSLLRIQSAQQENMRKNP